MAGLVAAFGALQAYNAEQKQEQEALFANIEQIKNETDANDGLIDRLKVLSKSNKDDASDRRV